MNEMSIRYQFNAISSTGEPIRELVFPLNDSPFLIPAVKCAVANFAS